MTVGEIRQRRDRLWSGHPRLSQYQHLCALMIDDVGPGNYYNHEVSDSTVASLDTCRQLFLLESLC